MDHSSRIPRPRLVLSVGITGHRQNKLLEHASAPCEEALRGIYATLDESLAEVAGLPNARFYAPEPALVRLISGLAIGADTLAVRTAPPTWRIEGVLPMPRAEYARDFPDAAAGAASPLADFERLLDRVDSVTELPLLTPELRTEADRAAQYAQLAEFLVRQVDVLIAIWDGEPAAGPGGTAAVVTQALDIGCMVVWIDPAHPEAPRILDGSAAAISPAQHSRPFDRLIVGEVLKGMLVPVAIDADGTPGRQNELPTYFDLPWPKPLHWAVGYSLLRMLGGGRAPKWPVSYASYDELIGYSAPFLAAAPAERDGNAFDRGIRDILLPRSAWADALAWHYGQLYRSAYVTTFLLGGLAVPIGLCYLFFADPHVVLHFKAGFAAIELAIILVVVFVVRRGSHRKWHRLWLETREISELLRLGRSLAYVGGLSELTNPATGGSGLPFFYARATFRELGLPNAVLDSEYLRKVLGATLDTEIVEQTAYHKKNTAELERLDHALHRIGNACFTATIVVTALFLCAWAVDLLATGGSELSEAGAHGGEAAAGGGPGEAFHEFLEYFFKPLVSILAAGLPAFGAAFAGIRAQSDFGELARRSEATLEALEDVTGRIRGMIALPSGRITLPATGNALLDFVHAMAADLGGWRQLFSRKPLVLPG